MIVVERPPMRQRFRRARACLVTFVVACLIGLAVNAWVASFDPRPWVAHLLGFVGFVPLGVPAALLVYATLRHGDPYRRY